MTQEIEIEYKNILTKDEFEACLHRYPFPESGVKQTNYYFETSDFSLKEHGCALRIREKNGKFVLTLKEPHPNGLLETHEPLSKEEAHEMINGKIVKRDTINNQLQNKNIAMTEIVYCGKLITVRREINYENVLLVLDYSMYNEAADYELEIEAPTEDIGKNFMNNFLAKNNINKRDTPTKIERFFASLASR
ncbi:CYTH domain-containing protein [Virgibacillus oceani]|uniref:CYTH domain-containing protein n=1 Tax=Virgibacillus oceani TaxID=1479511 RepID=A0A917M580_9BACI|nr:CYTH domain-containing protein [Virgibacillus oceani]GGG78152.1 CYTH domain-containing protein [Virgibacillus oceani]